MAFVEVGDQAGVDRLPTRVTAVDLLCFDGSRWNLRELFPLG